MFPGKQPTLSAAMPFDIGEEILVGPIHVLIYRIDLGIYGMTWSMSLFTSLRFRFTK